MATQPEVAVVGAGIVGTILALGLLKQKIPVRVYEQSSGFREIGAGIGVTAVAEACMSLMDPEIVAALYRCGAVPISDKLSDDERMYLRWIDGYNQHDGHDPSYLRPLAQIGDKGGKGFRVGCRRDQFLEELAKLIPEGVITFRKRVERIEEQPGNGRIILHFKDGTTAEADAVIGCDGIKSRVRSHVLGEDDPASHPQYTHTIAYRGLVPMDRAVEVLGEWRAHNFHNVVGPGAHMAHYAVANNTAVNVAVCVSDQGEWPDSSVMGMTGTRDSVLDAMRGWHPTVLGLLRLLPNELLKWGLFDYYEFPAARYNAGRVCIAGDAAHASTPHHGSGACFGIEDALCLTTLLAQVGTTAETPTHEALEAAFATFDDVRRVRTQWLVNSSRRVCELYEQREWADPKRWVKAMTCFEEIKDRFEKIYSFDVDGMVEQTKAEFQRRISSEKGQVSGRPSDEYKEF